MIGTLYIILIDTLNNERTHIQKLHELVHMGKKVNTSYWFCKTLSQKKVMGIEQRK